MIGIQRDARVLVVAAHPDDETLGCGGTIARFRQAGAEVRVFCLAEGITARYEVAAFETPAVLAEIAQRAANGRRALALLGVPDAEIFFDERLCCRLDTLAETEIVKAIERHARAFQPTIVLTHAGFDTNVDHRIIHRAVLAAFRPYHFPEVRAVLSFEVLSSTEWNPSEPFHADVFVDIGATMEAKLAALAAYGDEIKPPPHPRSMDVVRGLARYRGAQAGVEWAEAFHLLRMTWR